jgi:hypothetical protein
MNGNQLKTTICNLVPQLERRDVSVKSPPGTLASRLDFIIRTLTPEADEYLVRIGQELLVESVIHHDQYPFAVGRFEGDLLGNPTLWYVNSNGIGSHVYAPHRVAPVKSDEIPLRWQEFGF